MVKPALVRSTWVALVVLPLLLVSGCRDDGSVATPGAGASTQAGSASAAATPAPGASASTAPSGSPSPSASPSPSGSTDSAEASKQLEKQIIKDSGLDDGKGPDNYKGTHTITHKKEYSFEAPDKWAGVDDDDTGVLVAADIAKWKDGAAPGLSVNRYTATPAEALTSYVTEKGNETFFSSCTDSPTRPYDDGRNVGVAQTFADCEQTKDGTASVVVLSPVSDPSVSYVFDSTIIDARDISAVADAIRTFNLIS